ncbi:hypothetical protein AMEX_G22100 [Astyanax mexicanus]|uniref:Immunoglobulin V-set domain-containing protein n=1 Tax=Astyanax mexicanus TaxID=7994 RepID=A0A8B9H0J4_ASTMX|nr:hypothetical protein AMEX_G22100 [Astyanax mexicanus]
MSVYQLLIWILLEQTMASGEILYIFGVREQSVDISCEPKPENTQLTAFHLYRKSDQRKDLLLSVNQTGDKIHRPDYRRRIRISGRLNSSRVNVTLLDLRKEDTGLYVCEFRTAAKSQQVLKPTDVILLVKDGDCSCVSHTSLIYIITAAVVLLLFALSFLSAAHYRKAHPQPVTEAPIYEQMTTATPAHRSADHHPNQTHPTAKDPVYAVPQKMGNGDSPYAVPRTVKSICEAPQQESSPELVVETN